MTSRHEYDDPVFGMGEQREFKITMAAFRNSSREKDSSLETGSVRAKQVDIPVPVATSVPVPVPVPIPVPAAVLIEHRSLRLFITPAFIMVYAGNESRSNFQIDFEEQGRTRFKEMKLQTR
ncbi:hypothetical protein HZH66_014062 [Vespula vulgaris]|uniref:Uncharacterized protein n=1 Tax=Vespula vulgaris TaxID=7454 RepID=A0A834J4V7_VESVU|nr:hypothetical protein HZH66_014062 [Vespula vulgaris]